MKIQLEAEAFAKRISDLGFAVYIAECGTHGFITDDSESRVLSFSFDDKSLGSLSGNYGPPSTSSGTGWRIDKSLYNLNDKEGIIDALYANPPQWAGDGWKYLSTVAQYLQEYGASSRFARYKNRD